MALIKQVSLAFREYMVGQLYTIGLEFDNLVAQINTALRSIGSWTNVTWTAGNFTGNGTMTWTVGASALVTFEYALYGKTLDVHLHIVGSSVAGSLNTTLKVLVPANAIIGNTCSGAYSFRDNGTYGTGLWEAPSGGTAINFYRQDKSNWSASSSATDVRATLTVSTQ